MTTKTIRDRLKPNTIVTLTRCLCLKDPETGVKKEFPLGKYEAGELPLMAYELGYVTTSVSVDENINTKKNDSVTEKTAVGSAKKNEK